MNTPVQKPTSRRLFLENSTTAAVIGAVGTPLIFTSRTWGASREILMPEKLDWDVALAVPPVAMPGRTKFI